MYTKPCVESLGNAVNLVQSLKKEGSEIDPTNPTQQEADLVLPEE